MADTSATRNDAALRHFQSRAQQPKTLAAGNGANAYKASRPIIVAVEFDHPGYEQDYAAYSMADQIDASRFIHIGVTPQGSACNRSNVRRMNMGSALLESGFQY